MGRISQSSRWTRFTLIFHVLFYSQSAWTHYPKGPKWQYSTRARTFYLHRETLRMAAIQNLVTSCSGQNSACCHQNLLAILKFFFWGFQKRSYFIFLKIIFWKFFFSKLLFFILIIIICWHYLVCLFSIICLALSFYESMSSCIYAFKKYPKRIFQCKHLIWNLYKNVFCNNTKKSWK